jgi:hypothetical protein
MAKTRGMGLLMLWCDVDPEHEEEFNRWYDGEHIQRLLSVPGLLNAGRYVALKGGPKYLAMYELEDHLVLKTSAFLDEVRYRPSPWRQKSSGGHVGHNDGQPKYLTVYDFARADVPQSEPWNRVRDLNSWTHRIGPQLKLDAGSPAVFRRIWPA